MKIRRIIGLSLITATTGIAVLGCGGGDDESSTSSPTRAAATSPETTQAGESAIIEVEVKEFSFTPDTFEVEAGSPVTVRLTDKGLSLHTLTVFEDEAFTTPVPGADVAVSPTQPGEFTVTFDEAGTRYFRCGIHPDQMQGEITVQ